jgi:hypothetical protein
MNVEDVGPIPLIVHTYVLMMRVPFSFRDIMRSADVDSSLISMGWWGGVVRRVPKESEARLAVKSETQQKMRTTQDPLVGSLLDLKSQLDPRPAFSPTQGGKSYGHSRRAQQ